MSKKATLKYQGSNYFRQRLILSCLSGKVTVISNIRANSEDPGLREFEASFIRLLDRLSNGSHIEVNDTGTVVYFQPGILYGGKFEHMCSNQRGIGYYLEPLFMLAPFCKNKVEVTFKGITNNEIDPTIDMLNYSMMPVLKKLISVQEGLSLKMLRRGLPPEGTGEVVFTCPIIRSLKPFQWLESGLIKKIRGVAYTSRVAPGIANRIMETAKKEFLKYLTDVYFTINTGKGKSPGYGMTCMAETTKGSIFVAEVMSSRENTNAKSPEDVGKESAWHLLEEIYRGGCVDSLNQSLILLLMALTPKDVCKVALGPLTPYTMHFLRHLKDYFGVMFKIDTYKPESPFVDDSDEQERSLGADKLCLTCVGIGYSNIGKGQI